mmetsp:Transcript_20311/g.48131  ORF Transcript_20311/g.48131 Transcript_20311/m.48131 type:complete len:247 (+) Transcript_20311:285-1025(+)
MSPRRRVSRFSAAVGSANLLPTESLEDAAWGSMRGSACAVVATVRRRTMGRVCSSWCITPTRSESTWGSKASMSRMRITSGDITSNVAAQSRRFREEQCLAGSSCSPRKCPRIDASTPPRDVAFADDAHANRAGPLARIAASSAPSERGRSWTLEPDMMTPVGIPPPRIDGPASERVGPAAGAGLEPFATWWQECTKVAMSRRVAWLLERSREAALSPACSSTCWNTRCTPGEEDTVGVVLPAHAE